VSAVNMTVTEAGSPPAGTRETRPSVADIQRGRPVPHSVKRALVVEDDDDMREVLGRVLHLDHFECRTVASGREALAHLSASCRDRPVDADLDLILVDIRMPEMDGLELTRRIRAEDETPAIVVATAVDDLTRVREALRLGADGYLVKPFSSRQLRSTCEQALERRLLYGELMRAKQAREELLDLVFHDLRNPLSVTRGYLSLMQACPAAMSARNIASAAAACDAIVNMIDEVTDLRRLQRAEAPVQLKTLSLENVTLDTVNSWQPLAEGTARHIHVRSATDIPPVVADEQLLRRVIRGLLACAAKHARGKTGVVVELAWEPESSHVKLAITDDGPPVPVEVREGLFDELRQGELCSLGSRRGQGVALPFAREACRRMGGSIWVEDVEPRSAHSAEERAGCRFVVALPAESLRETSQPGHATFRPDVQAERNLAL